MSRDAKSLPDTPSGIACIGRSVVVRGDVFGSEDLAVEGQIEGRIELPDHNVMVGASGWIKAEILAGSVTICGAVTGNVTATEKVEIREIGSLDGDIVAPRLSMVDGAILRGNVRQPAPDIVEEADEESFPASDAPAHSVVTRILDRPLEPGEFD